MVRAIALVLTALFVAVASPQVAWAAGGHQKSGEGEVKKQKTTAPPTFKRSGASSGEVGFLKLASFPVSVLDEKKVQARLYLGIDLETTGGEKEDKLVNNIPRLQANYVSFLTRAGNPTIKGGKLQLDYIKAQLQRITDETVGKGIGTVLIREAVKQ